MNFYLKKVMQVIVFVILFYLLDKSNLNDLFKYVLIFLLAYIGFNDDLFNKKK